MKRWYTLCIAFWLLLPLGLAAQQAVWLGGRRVVPEQNVRRALRGAPDVGQATGGMHNVLVQFAQIPTEAEIQRMANEGLVLGDYLGGNAYFALLREGSRPWAVRRGESRLTSVMALRPEWKMSARWESSIPSYARVAERMAAITLYCAPNASEQEMAARLAEAGCRCLGSWSELGMVRVEVAVANLPKVAALPWVLRIEPTSPDPVLVNHSGRTLGRASVLNLPVALGGRGLLGKGTRVGIWDANVVTHPDFGGRVHPQEYELGGSNAEHGTHVAGTVLGAGMLDPDGRGMAPKAEAYTYNFNKQSNGKTAQQEMDEAARTFGITLTQNSYGLPLGRLCSYYDKLSYLASDYELDRLATLHPTLTHVFAAGNDQDGCEKQVVERWGTAGYGTVARRAKNVINVAALQEDGSMTDFSSWGPQDDGRLFPTVAAKGGQVYSTKPAGEYQSMDGTSMACPTVTGHLALVQERYRQLNRGAHMQSDLLRAVAANTADDAGRKGPDFQYGFGILNAEKAVIALEKGYYQTGVLKAGESAQVKIANIPATAQGLRVMLVWNDPASAAEVDYGSPVMINNLDLKVDAGGKEYLPWVLNATKGHVEDLPTRKADALNNIEQVTLDATDLAGANEAQVTLTGTTVTNGEQHYALVWWIDEPELRVVYPGVGELLVPGGKYVARIEGAQKNYRLELSYDGGKSYKELKDVALTETQNGRNIPFTIPADAQITSTAVLRLVEDGGARVAKSGLFSIAPQPTSLELSRSDCGYTGWKLTWKGSPLATKGYAVLLGNTETAEWEKIGVTDGPDKLSLDIDEAVAKKLVHPLFAVAARTGDDTWGKRSQAVVADGARPVKPAVGELPIVETFRSIPPKMFKVKGGSNVNVRYVGTLFGNMPVGSNLMGLVVKSKLAGFDPNNWFGASNAGNTSELQLCELDLTGHEDVMLHITGGLYSAKDDDPTTARIRLLDGNGNPIKSQLGTEEQQVQPGVFDWYFPLKGEKYSSLKLQFCGQLRNDMLIVTRMAIEKGSRVPDVALTQLTKLTNGANLGVTPVTVRLTNKSIETIRNVEVRAYVNGAWKGATVVDEIPANGIKVVDVNVDLSTKAVLGEMMEVRLQAELKDEVYTDDNSVVSTVNNLGRVVPMGTSVMTQSFFGPLAVDPKVTYEVTEPVIFTDDGGFYGLHSDKQVSTMKFVPKDPSMRVRVTFKKFDIDADESTLYVYTTDVLQDLGIQGLRKRATLSGNSQSLPMSFISEAKDGGITFRFESQDVLKDGWVAEVDLVPVQNPLTLVSVEARHVGQEKEAKIPVKATVRNNWVQEQPDVTVALWDGNTVLLRTKVTLKPGENEVAFEEGLPMALSTNQSYEVYLEGSDAVGADNQLDVMASYDSYCIPNHVAKPGVLALGMLSVEGTQLDFAEPTPMLQYQLKEEVTVYTKDGKVTLRARLAHNEVKDGAVLAAWVDWNGDFQFTDDEKSSVTFEQGKQDGEFEMTVPADAQPGTKRMRLMLLSKAEAEQGPCVTGTLMHGDMRDVSLILKEGVDPNRNDLTITGIDAGGSGVDLVADQKVKVTIRNNSYQPYAGKVKVKLSVDGNEVAGVTDIDCSASPLSAYRGEATYELDKGVNLSAQGKHTVTVEITERPEAVTPENNSKSVEVYCAKAQMAKLMALHIDSRTNSESTDKIDVSAAAKLLPTLKTGDSRTVELLVNLDRKQHCNILNAKGFQLIGVNGIQGFPDGGLAVVLQRQQWDYTRTGVLTPGTWHHIAVIFTDVYISDVFKECKVEIYVDGKKCETISSGEAAPNFADMKLAARFAGQVDALRLWDNARSEQEIKDNMYKFVRQANKELPEHCVAEYSFDEGPKNAMSFSGRTPAIISVEDASLIDKDDETGTWRTIATDKLISDFHFDTQVGAWSATATPNEYEVLLPKKPEFHKTKGWVSTVWLGASVKMGGQELTADTEFDFTGSKSVSLTAERKGIFGKDFAQTVTIKPKYDKSNSNTLTSISLSESKNDWLKQTVNGVIDGLDVTLPLDVATTGKPEPSNKIHAAFVSDGLHVLVDGKEYDQAGSAEINLHQPNTLTVVAANGEKRIYTIRLACKQSITWNPATLEYTYGDEAVALDAEADSKLPVSYTSSNPTAVSEANGKLHFGAPGESELTAQQLGGGIFEKAIPVAKQFKVNRRAVNVTAALTAKLGEPIQWDFTYETLVNASDALNLPSPIAKGAFKLKSMDGAHEYQFTDQLGVGEYKLEAVAANAYETELYKVTPVDGTLKIEQGDNRTITFIAQDGAGAKLEQATVTVGKANYVTNAEGVATAVLAGGVTHAWTASKEGYSPASGELAVSKDEDAQVVATLQLADLKLTYSAAAHGSLLGKVEQQVAKGVSGEPVMAMPELGYQFSQWSDGRKDNPRVDADVQADVQAEAQFAIRSVRIKYIMGEGGQLTGSAEQQLDALSDGEEVTAVPLDGYYFVAWSDGNTSPTRKETRVLEDIELTANFGQIVPIPQRMDFEAKRFTDGWQTISDGKDYCPFEVSDEPLYGGKIMLDGYFAISNSDKYGKKNVRSTLLSPRYRLDGVDKPVLLSFDYIFFRLLGAEFILYYTVDGQTWEKWEELTSTRVRRAKDFKLEPAKFAGKQFVQFKWVYTAGWDYYVLIDNVNVYLEDAVSHELTYVAEPADAGKFLIDGAEQTSQMVQNGQLAKPVEAVPNAGYRFMGWKDGLGNEPVLAIPGPTIKAATYTAVFHAEKSLIISYSALPADGGKVLMDGVEVQKQEVELGTDAKPVVASPAEGFHFVRWNSNGSEDPTLVQSAVMRDMETQVVFATNTYDVSFVVTSNGTPVENATLILGGKSGATDAAGQHTFNVTAGTHVYTVNAAGFASKGGEVVVKDAAMVINVDLAKDQTFLSYAVNFTVMAKGQPLADATVTVDGKAHKTSADGKVSISLPAGTHAYKVEAERHMPSEGNVEVVDKPVNVDVELALMGYEVTYTSSKGGTLVVAANNESLASGTLVEHGAEILIMPKADANYKLERLLVNGEDKASALRSGSLTMVLEAKLHVEATFVATGGTEPQTAVEEAALAGVMAYPNPFADVVRVSGVEKATRIQVLNANGAVITTIMHNGSSEVQLNLADLPSGVYLIVVERGAARKAMRMVKNR